MLTVPEEQEKVDQLEKFDRLTKFPKMAGEFFRKSLVKLTNGLQ